MDAPPTIWCLVALAAVVIMITTPPNVVLAAHNLPDGGAADHLSTRSHEVVSPLRTVFNRMDCLVDDANVTPEEMAVFIDQMDTGEVPPSVSMIMPYFKPHDLDTDGVISWAEFESTYSYMDWPMDAAQPTQIHLSIAADQLSLTVMWAQNTTVSPFVQYGTTTSYGQTTMGTTRAYSVGSGALKYTSLPIHTTNLTGLQPLTQYHYRVGDGMTWSPDFTFMSPPDYRKAAPSEVSWAVFGDMGTTAPMGAEVTKSLTKEHATKPFNLALHVGDLCYAGVNKDGEWEPTWDAWMVQIEPLTRYMPYQVTVGNHENYFNYTAYRYRFDMAGNTTGGYESFYYGFDYGNVHVTSFSSELPYGPGSVQYKWIEQDFIRARARNVSWLMVSVHRPFYSSDKGMDYPLRADLEPLLLKYGVDLVLTGHAHCYERTYPVANGISQGTPGQTVFVRPKAPIYMTQGTAGALIFETWLPQPDWSANRQQNYGFGRMTMYTNATSTWMHYQFKAVDPTKILDEFWIYK